MRAKVLFQPTHDLSNSRRHVAALIILQSIECVYYSIFMTAGIIWTTRVARGATDGIRIYANPDWYLSLPTDGQRAFFLAHECEHILMKHPQRAKIFIDRGFFRAGIRFIAKLWNVAADYMINANLVARGFEPIPEGLYSDKYTRDDLVDAIYIDLYNENEDGDGDPDGDQDGDQDGESDGGADCPQGQPAPESGSDGDQDGDQSGDQDNDQDGDSDGDDAGNGTTPDKSEGDDEPGSGTGTDGDPDADAGTGTGTGTDGDSDADAGTPDLPEPAGHDDHLTPVYEGDAEEQAEAAREDEYQLRRAVDAGIDQAIADGRDPSTMSESIIGGSMRYNDDYESATDWREQLADRFTRAGQGGESTWSKIHRRRYAILNVVSPTSIGQVGRISVVVDTSGSVNRQVLNSFMGESAAMIDMLQPRDGVVVAWTDTDVQRVDEVYSGSELLDLEAPMGGGTYLTSGVEYLESNGLDSELTLVFTDGYLSDEDWNELAQRDDLVVVLDRQPCTWVQRDINRVGIDVIIAEAA